MSNCLVCGKDTPPVTKVTRWGLDRKYCSKNCIKTAYVLANKDKVIASKQRWLENNPEKRKEVSALFMKRNRPYYTQYSSLRTRKVQRAQPKWSNKDDLLDVYKEAEYLGLEVDHIIPITHKLVCGLHVWDNLQLLSRSENAKKSNRFSDDDDLIAIVREDA